MKTLTEGRDIEALVADDLPLVLVDSELIQMVLRHLIDNALKYSRPGTPIRIGAQASENEVTISVADHGPGIPENEQAQIFDKFYRSSKSSHQIKGTGMGLPIAREILRAHGRDIWVQSNPGLGSIFCFSLPIAPQEKNT
jgi:signal transduction histidine kinase